MVEKPCFNAYAIFVTFNSIMKGKITFTIAFITLLIAILSSCFTNGKGDIPDKISFNFHIRPILSDKCVKVHGPDTNKRQAGLRLDIADSALAPLKETKGAYAIVPGKPEESELYKRISSTDTSYMMPAPESHLDLLSDHEIRLFKKWIQQGAHYETHWSLTPPKKSPLPTVGDRNPTAFGWAKNEIDYFILQKLDENDLSPS